MKIKAMYSQPGESVASVAGAFGISHTRVRQIVGQAATSAKKAALAEPSVKAGDLIGKWEVLALGWTKTKPRRQVALCRCTCPARTEKVVALSSLMYETSRSCGCLARDITASRMLDGFPLSNHPLYGLWMNIRARCYNPHASGYVANGKQGIGLYEPWRDDSRAFITWVLENLGPRPDGARLVLISKAGDYAPGNIKWSK